jgi:ABC-type dipeptide/oligopeptide/nickel transport system ATPase subunit/GNAT superfamily N-acetyltransferase
MELTEEENRFEAEIAKVRKRSRTTEVRLADGRQLKLPPFIYIREGDIAEVSLSQGKPVLVRKRLRHGGTIADPLWVTVLPPYCISETIHVPPHEFNITFRERLSSKDWQKAKRLEQFHYRGQGLNKIVGRRTVLLAVEEQRGTIAYGVVSATFPLAKPRFELLETNFEKQMKSRLINQIVRIPRIVVHPEFRGIGLGTLMAKHLVEYVRQHWDINGYPPILVEVIAAMTDYHRFFESAGFIRLGDTAGYEGSKFHPLYGNGTFDARENSSNYNFLEDQAAKPYLVYPLTPEIEQRVREKAEGLPTELQLVASSPMMKRPIVINNVSVTYKARNGLTKRAAIVRDVFGIDETQMYGQVLNDFSLTVYPGDVVLLTGASGSGKSTAIRLLTETKTSLKDSMRISGEIEGFRGYRRSDLVARLSHQWDENLPLIDQIGNSITEAIRLLNNVGLAEAHLYLKHPSQISEGQKYRFAVALLCDSKKPVWVADEFASTLDPETAAIVAKGFRRIAQRYGATVILAAAHTTAFVDSLLPNTIVRLSWGDTIEVWSVKMNVAMKGNTLSLSIRNRSPQPVQYLQVGGVDDHGQFHHIFEIPNIAQRATSSTLNIPIEKLERFKALIVRSPYKVGDIAYITSTHAFPQDSSVG